MEAVEYAACMEVCDSDHKPVYSRLRVSLPVTLQEERRRECSRLLKESWGHSLPDPPNVLLSKELISLHPVRATRALQILATCRELDQALQQHI